MNEPTETAINIYKLTDIQRDTIRREIAGAEKSLAKQMRYPEDLREDDYIRSLNLYIWHFNRTLKNGYLITPGPSMACKMRY